MTRNDFTILSPLKFAHAPATARKWRGSCAQSLILVRGPQLFLLPLLQPRLLSDADAGEGVKQSKYIQEPQHHADDHDCVQDRLDAACHGDEPIHQPQEDSNYDQG